MKKHYFCAYKNSPNINYKTMKKETFAIHEEVIKALKKAGFKQIEIWKNAMFCHYDNEPEDQELPIKNKNGCFYELTKRTNYKI